MKKEPIAIVGIGAIFPGAKNYADFWNNSLDAKCFVREVPDDFWRKEDFYDPDPKAPDKTYAKKAGVLDSIEFDAMEFGIPPKVMQSISADQLFALVAARQALIDAGMYGKNAKPFDKSRTGVIISASIAKNVYELSLRTNAPEMRHFMENCNIPKPIIDRVLENYKNSIIEWDEASNPGYLANVVSGRIANRFNFTGTTCSVDAACASGIAAVKFSAQELWLDNCDIMLAGGVMMDISNVSFVSFSKTPALSKTGHIRPFDARADGMLLGDGVGVIVLKRLSKAEADGDRIYSIIEGIGSSSDGREKSVFSPSKNGQVLAITRGLNDAKVKPKQIGMIEAHGTGTLVGDSCEVKALSEIFNQEKETSRSLVLGGCKGQTGHMRLAAGIASIIRAALAVYHKQFLPCVGCEILNPDVEKSNMYICKKPEPWIINSNKPDRYASISGFGFGGTNYNVLIKEYKKEHKERYRYTNVPYGVLLSGKDAEELKKSIIQYIEKLKKNPEEIDSKKFTYRNINKDWCRIGFVAKTVDEAIKKAEYALKNLENNHDNYWNENGIFYRKTAISKESKVCLLFSGQGSQYREMLAGVTGAYPEMRQAFTSVDNALIKNGKKPISDMVYAKAWSSEEQQAAEKELSNTEYTQPALAAIESGLYDLMKNRGLIADLIIGHSFGELVALYVAGVYDKNELMNLAVMRGECMSNSLSDADIGMIAVMAEYKYAKELINSCKDVYIANVNSPNQIVISGRIDQLEKIESKAFKDKIYTKRLNVSGAFHSPFMTSAQENFDKVLEKAKFYNANKKVISNYGAVEYANANSVRNNLGKQLTNPVLFQQSVEKAYEDGARVFIEIGPGHVLSKLVKECLNDKNDFITISVNSDKNDDDLSQLETALVYLATLGMSIKEDPYHLEINPEIINKKTPNTYTVPPTNFLLPETKERIEDARHRKECFDDVEYRVRNINDNQEDEEMKNYDVLCEIEKLNAEVFENYIKFQSNNLTKINEMLNSKVVQKTNNQKLLFNYVSNFQNDSLNALKIYFNEQATLFGGQVFNNEGTKQIASDVIENASIKEIEEEEEEETEEEVVVEEEVVENKNSKVESEISIKELVIKIIVEITGFPSYMIQDDMSLESDLGIDSIKRLELFSNINDKLGSIFGQEDMVVLAAVQSVKECIDVVTKLKAEGKTVVWTTDDKEVLIDSNVLAMKKSQAKKLSKSFDVENIVLKSVGKKTSYEVDKLDLNMKFEDDLGVDFISKMDIIRDINVETGNLLDDKDTEMLSNMNVIKDVVKYLDNLKEI